MAGFEVAALDIRVNDLAAGLAMAVDRGTPHASAQEAAFRRGYRRVIDLEPAEDAAMAVLARRRALGSVIWRAGRGRMGLSGLDDLRDRLAVLSARTVSLNDAAGSGERPSRR